MEGGGGKDGKREAGSEGEPRTRCPVSGPRVTIVSCALIGLALGKRWLSDHVNDLLSSIAMLNNIVINVLVICNIKLCHC